MPTLSQMSSTISKKLVDDSNVAVTSAQIKTAINEAITYWKRRALWFNEFEETITLTAENPAFSLSTNTPLYIFPKGGVAIDYSDQRYPLTKVSTSYYDRINAEFTGLPFLWTYRNDGFEVYYYPDQAYSVIVRGIKDYTAFATNGDDDAETNDWLTEAELVIQYWALSRLHGEFRQDEKMESYYTARAENEYENLMKFMGEKVRTGTAQIHSCLI